MDDAERPHAHRPAPAAPGRVRLSFQDYEVLVQLVEAPDGKLRVTELARALSWERSRVSHHIRRMIGRGLVECEECGDDGRGALVVVSTQGHVAMELAAPEHIRRVRDLVFAALDDGELRVVSAFADGVLSRLAEAESVDADSAPPSR